MTPGLVMMDPALLATLTTAARQVTVCGEATSARLAAIAQAAAVSPIAAALVRDAAAQAHEVVELTQGILDRHAEVAAGGRWSTGALTGWRIRKPDAGPIADALATLRTRRGSIDADGNGTIDETELRAATEAADPALAAAAAFVLDGAPLFPSPTSADAPRPSVPELLAVVNSVAPGERRRLLGEVAAEVAGSGAARSVRFELVAAGTPMDTSEREVGRVLSVEQVTVPTLERLRAWDVPVPRADMSELLQDLAPPGTAAVALTYRREQTVREYTIDPVRDVPGSVGQLVDHIAYLDTAYDVVNGTPFLGHGVGLALDGIDWGLAVWDAVDDIIGDDHPRMDTAVEFGVEYFDAGGTSLGTTASVEMPRVEVSGPLFAEPGAVVVVPHVVSSGSAPAGDDGDD